MNRRILCKSLVALGGLAVTGVSLRGQSHPGTAPVSPVPLDDAKLADAVKQGATMEEIAKLRDPIATTPAQALRALKVGNARFFGGLARRPEASAAERRSQILGQTPFAVILSCSDSRVPTEIIFDQGLGSLFITREQVKRFRQEAEWASMLNHPNVLTIFETGIEDGVYFIATEYIDGLTLRQTLNKPIDLMQVLAIAEGVTKALMAAHELWLIHRDIKPENIMVRHDGLVKVLDFGVAKLTQNLSVGLTLPNMVIGTLEYLSPEQIEGEAVDPRTDLHALGVVLYEMLVGRTPFAADSVVDIISNVRSVRPDLSGATLRGASAEITVFALPELDRITRKLLEKNPELRYQSGKELLKELEDFRAELQFLMRASTIR